MEVKVSQEDMTKLVNRLKRLEGQVRGIRKMLVDGRGCEDLLTQISAVDKSMRSLSTIILENHIKNNVVDEIEKGNHEAIDEVIEILRRFL